MRSQHWLKACAGLGIVGCITVIACASEEYLSGIVWPKPPVIDPGNATTPPSDAIVLFDGKDLSAWENGDKWVVEEGYAQVKGTDIKTKEPFGDCQLHIEWAAPKEARGSGQGRGNSGIFFMDRYELQVLDCYNNETYHDGQTGAIYKQQPPMVNACRPPGEWQTYDVTFTAPHFDDSGNLIKPATITVFHNGVCIHNHTELQGATSYTEPPRYTAHGPKGPIRLQDHGDPVRYRNIWIRELKPIIGTPPVGK